MSGSEGEAQCQARAGLTSRCADLSELVKAGATEGAGGTMSTRSGPGRGRSDPGHRAVDSAVDSAVNSAVLGERRQLINLAYRLLGSMAEAEDAVQEAYARWYALPPEQQDAIDRK